MNLTCLLKRLLKSINLTCLWNEGGSRCSLRKPTQAQGGYARAKHQGQSWELNTHTQCRYANHLPSMLPFSDPVSQKVVLTFQSISGLIFPVLWNTILMEIKYGILIPDLKTTVFVKRFPQLPRLGDGGRWRWPIWRSLYRFCPIHLDKIRGGPPTWRRCYWDFIDQPGWALRSTHLCEHIFLQNFI